LSISSAFLALPQLDIINAASNRRNGDDECGTYERCNEEGNGAVNSVISAAEANPLMDTDTIFAVASDAGNAP
jgi:hypothetical protein